MIDFYRGTGVDYETTSKLSIDQVLTMFLVECTQPMESYQ